MYKEYFDFDLKGGFEISSASSLYGSGMPGYGGAANSYTNKNGTTSSFSSMTPNSMAGGGGEKQDPNGDLYGSYVLDGYTLELHTKNGNTVRKLFFFAYPGKQDAVVLDGITYWIDKD